MLSRIRSYACCLAILCALAACSLNPQPEPPLNDRGLDASYGMGGAAGANPGGGSGGGLSLDASSDAFPPPSEAGVDACSNCDCSCYAGGTCEAGPDGECPCEAGDAGDGGEVDAAPDSGEDAVTQD